jgi:para-aminobenzoate synthetase component 1
MRCTLSVHVEPRLFSDSFPLCEQVIKYMRAEPECVCCNLDGAARMRPCPLRVLSPAGECHSVNTIQLEALPYAVDGQVIESRDWFLRIRTLGHAVWLDSSHPHSPRGRYDIISAAPLAIIEATPGADTFAAVQRALISTFDAEIAPIVEGLSGAAPILPFQGGAIGLFGYELGRELEGLAPRSESDPSFPNLLVGIYSWAIISDHTLQRTYLLIRPETPDDLRHELLARINNETAKPNRFVLEKPWRQNFSHSDYAHAFAKLQNYIRAGDCYQVNLARRFQVRYEGDPLAAYLALRPVTAAPFSAYFETPDGAVLCLSPERLLSAQGRDLMTQPIKGTIARSDDAAVDKQRAQSLLLSEKNRAENLMIVDLLRNDLGRSCEPGSINVEQLFELQSYATVHHLVSSISGKLRADLHALDALRNCFPGGSITGAPKRRAMQIIDELEPHNRSVFCGAMGYISVCGRMDTNITIRTLLAQRGKLFAWAGGGITADSDCDEEFEETRSKIEPLLRALELL